MNIVHKVRKQVVINNSGRVTPQNSDVVSGGVLVRGTPLGLSVKFVYSSLNL